MTMPVARTLLYCDIRNRCIVLHLYFLTHNFQNPYNFLGDKTEAKGASFVIRNKTLSTTPEFVLTQWHLQSS